MPSRKMEAVAYHEAGHAVAALLLHRPLRYVSIVPDKERGILGYDLMPRRRTLLEREIMVLLAGEVAEEEFRGWRNRVGARSDYDKAHKCARAICETDEEAVAYVTWLRVRIANQILGPVPWSIIKAVAADLLVRERLTVAEVRVIRSRVLNMRLTPFSEEFLEKLKGNTRPCKREEGAAKATRKKGKRKST
jgi:hypothetical protein